MNIFLKDKKGMTLVEVIISITLLGVILLPIMMLFNGSILMANKIKGDIDTDAVVQTIKQVIIDSVKSNPVKGIPKKTDINTSNPNQYVPNATSFNVKDLIDQSVISGNLETSDMLCVFGVNGDIKRFFDYGYKVQYDHGEHYDSSYPNVYNFVLIIYKNDSVKGDVVLQRIKISARSLNQLH